MLPSKEELNFRIIGTIQTMIDDLYKEIDDYFFDELGGNINSAMNDSKLLRLKSVIDELEKEKAKVKNENI